MAKSPTQASRIAYSMSWGYLHQIEYLQAKLFNRLSLQFYLTEASPSTGLYGYVSPPIIITYLLTEIRMNVTSHQDKPTQIRGHANVYKADYRHHRPSFFSSVIGGFAH